MKFSRTRKIENNVFETTIKFKSFGGDTIYNESEEQRLINDFGSPCIEIGLIKGKYDVKTKEGKKEIKAMPYKKSVEKYVFDSEESITAEHDETISGQEKEIEVCAHLRGHKVLDENFCVTLKLPIKDETGKPCKATALTTEKLSEYEGKCRLFEETIIARAKLAIKDLYAKDTIFETEDAEEVVIAVNTEPQEVLDPHADENIFIG